jgi:hypothetical protein
MTGTLLTTIAVIIVPADYAEGDDHDDNGDGNRQKAEDDSSATLDDCDDNEVEQAGFDCITNDVEIEPPAEESTLLSVCKQVIVTSGIGSEEDFDFTITGNNPEPNEFEGSADCVDVTIGPGEYAVSEVNTGPAGENHLTRVEGDCVQDPNIAQRATGEIQAGETQECTFINEIVL